MLTKATPQDKTPRTVGPMRALIASALLSLPAIASAASLVFFDNPAQDYDYGRQLTLPAGFGTGEFTLEIWLKLDESYPVGPTTGSNANQRLNWSNSNTAPYSNSQWWWPGNFLLDGHNNSTNYPGTFSLQVFNGGRLRWLFGDTAAAARVGSLHAVQNASSATLLNGAWHQVTLVRRWDGDSGAILEMWIDGSMVDSETSTAQTNMATTYWTWAGFPQAGWMWGAEKQVALGSGLYEDYKGLIDELRFWSRAKSTSEIQNGYNAAVTGNEPGLVGRYSFDEGQGSSACNSLVPTQCATLTATSAQPNMWSALNAPLGAGGDVTPPTRPTNLAGAAVSSSRIDLTWTASTDNVAVAFYRVRRDGAAVGTPATNSFSDTGLTPNSAYSYTVSAVDSAGNESMQSDSIQRSTPASSDLEPPSMPRNLRTSSAPTASQVALAWDAATDNVGVTGYQVYRNGALLSSPSTSSYVDTTVAANTGYSYTVVARDAAGNSSSPSAALSVTTSAGQPPTPPPPTNPPQSSGGGGGGVFHPLLLLLFAALRLRKRARHSRERMAFP